MTPAWQNVESLLNEMIDVLRHAGIPERQLKMPEGDPLKIKIDRYAEIFDWMHDLKMSPEYLAAEKAYKLVPPERWANYKVVGATGLREQLISESANIALRHRWKQERPNFFGRKHGKSKAETTEQTTTGESAD